MLPELQTLQLLARRTDGRVGVDWGGTGIETLDGVVLPVVLLGEVLAVIGVENLMPLHRRLVAGDEVEVPDVEETGTATVTMIIGGYRHPEGIVILHLPGAVDVEVVVGTVGTAGEVGGGQRIQDLAAHPAETPDTIECAIDPDDHTIRGHYAGCSIEVDNTTIFDL